MTRILGRRGITCSVVVVGAPLSEATLAAKRYRPHWWFRPKGHDPHRSVILTRNRVWYLRKDAAGKVWAGRRGRAVTTLAFRSLGPLLSWLPLAVLASAPGEALVARIEAIAFDFSYAALDT